MTILQNVNNKLMLDPTGKLYMKGSILAVWNMTESSGTVMGDATSMKNDGTIGSAVTLNSGSYTFIRDYDSNVIINSPESLYLSNFTFNCWVTPPSNLLYATTSNMIIYLRDANSTYRVHFNLNYNASNQFNVGGTLYNGVAVASAGSTSWQSTGSSYMATLTWDGTTIKAYVNASVQNIIGTLSSGTFSIVPKYAEIGSTETNGYLQATVNQLAVWNRELSGTEITSLYNSGAGLAYSSWPESLKN